MVGGAWLPPNSALSSEKTNPMMRPSGPRPAPISIGPRSPGPSMASARRRERGELAQRQQLRLDVRLHLVHSVLAFGIVLGERAVLADVVGDARQFDGAATWTELVGILRDHIVYVQRGGLSHLLLTRRRSNTTASLA